MPLILMAFWSGTIEQNKFEFVSCLDFTYRTIITALGCLFDSSPPSFVILFSIDIIIILVR
jgi:hypothetical protein